MPSAEFWESSMWRNFEESSLIDDKADILTGLNNFIKEGYD